MERSVFWLLFVAFDEKVTRRNGEKVTKRRHRKWNMLSFNTHANAIKLET